MQKNTRTRLLAALAITALLLAGCTGPLQNAGDSAGTGIPASGKGVARVSLGGPAARTLLPGAELLYYALSFSLGDATVKPPLVHATSADVTLEPGTWTLQVTAYISEEEAETAANPAASGSVPVTVAPGKVTAVNVALSGVTESGTGTLSYNIEFPEDAQSAVLKLTPLAGGDDQEINLTTKASDVLSLSAGYYRLSLEISVYDGEAKTTLPARKTRLIHIYNGQETLAAESFGAGDFALIYTFTTIESLAEYLEAAAENTAETPYRLALRDLDVESGLKEGTDPLRKLFDALNGKYVSLDLSACTGDTIADATAAEVMNARPDKDKIISLVLPATLKTLGNYALYSCASLSSVEWPAAPEEAEIGTYVFSGCTSLVSVKLPATLKNLGNYAFNACSSLETLVLPAALETIGTYAFQNCTSLSTISLPGDLTSIGSYAFSGCAGLQSVYIPENMTAAFETNIFAGCGYIVFDVAGGNTTFHSELSGKLLIRETVLVAASREIIAGALTIPADVTEIAVYTFDGCKYLSSVSLPTGLTAIGDYAFRACRSLTSITLPAGLTSIGNYAFQNCVSLQSALWPTAGMNPALGTYAFDGCASLASVSLPDNLTAIGNYAFRGCASMTSILWPSALTRIGSSAFSNTGITAVTIPTGVTTIGDSAFSGCISLQSATWSTDVSNPTLGASAFRDCTSLASVSLPDNLTAIGNTTFRSCSSLTSISLPNTLTSIGNDSFYFTGLTTLTLPANLKTVGSQSFRQCNSLRWVKWPLAPPDAQLPSVGYAFSYCVNLEKVELPPTLTYIGQSTFGGSEKLKAVILYAETPPTIQHINAFNNAHEDLKIYVPDASLDEYKATGFWSSNAAINRRLDKISNLADQDKPENWN
jgi:hypothetical protein